MGAYTSWEEGIKGSIAHGKLADLVVLSKNPSLVDPEEIIRLQEVLAKEIDLLGLPAETASGKSLGVVENFLVDSETQAVVKYYLRDLLGQSRVMDAGKVIRIDKTIVFADDESEVKSGVAETQTA